MRSGARGRTATSATTDYLSAENVNVDQEGTAGHDIGWTSPSAEPAGLTLRAAATHRTNGSNGRSTCEGASGDSDCRSGHLTPERGKSPTGFVFPGKSSDFAFRRGRRNVLLRNKFTFQFLSHDADFTATPGGKQKLFRPQPRDFS